MAAHAATPTAWEAGLDPALVARLARPLRQPGLISLAIVRRIHGAVDALLGRLWLLERFSHQVRALAAPETPIVHAHGLGARREAAPAAVAPVIEARAPLPPPIVRGIERTVERTIVVEEKQASRVAGESSETELHDLGARREAAPATGAPVIEAKAPLPPPPVQGIERTVERTIVVEPSWPLAPRQASHADVDTSVPVAGRELVPAPVRANVPSAGAMAVAGEPGELRERIEVMRLHELRERIESSATSSTRLPSGSSASPAPAEPIEQSAPSTRRSRMGTPIARRAAEPRELPVLVERVEPTSRAIAERAAAEPAASAAIAATKPLVVRAVVVTPARAPETRTPIVTPSRQALTPRAPTTNRAAVPVVRRATTAPDATPMAHAAASRAPRTQITASAAGPVVSPRTRIAHSAEAARPELAQPLAHVAPRGPVPAAEAVRAVPMAAAQSPMPPPVARREPKVPPPPPPPKLDLHEIADHVQHILARRALQERERRGVPR